MAIPFNKNVSLTINAVTEGTASISIVDAQGRLVANRNVEVAAGSTALMLQELNEANPGVYFVKVTQGTEAKMVRLVKVN